MVLTLGSNGACLKRQIGEASNSDSKRQKLGPVTDREREPAEDRVWDREVVEVVGDGLLDEVRHAVHDGGEEVTHTGDYLKHSHKLTRSVYESEKTPPKRQIMIARQMSYGGLHVTHYKLPVLGLNCNSVTAFSQCSTMWILNVYNNFKR